MKNGLSIITICFNDKEALQKTVASVSKQTFTAYEQLIIDGGSTDATIDYLKTLKTNKKIKAWSEPDEGIYDAMNKGLQKARNAWVFFLNAGDCFLSEDALASVMPHCTEPNQLVYCDVTIRDKYTWLFKADHDAMRVHHQGLVYRKDLHEKYGPYLVGQGVTISDYIFFNQCKRENWKYLNINFAEIDATGVSASRKGFYQKMAVDLMFGRRKNFKTGLILILYPVYRAVKRFVRTISGR